MTTKEKDPAPLSREKLRFVTEFRKYRDVYKAAEKAHIPKNQAVRVFNSPEFQNELERQDEAIRQERAKQEAKAEALTNELIDRELAGMVTLDPKTHGQLKLEAIRTALVVNGRIQNGQMRSLEVPSGGDDPEALKGPTFVYKAVVEGNVTQVAATPMVPPEAAAPAASQAPPAAAPKVNKNIFTPDASAAGAPRPHKQLPPFRRRAGAIKVE